MLRVIAVVVAVTLLTESVSSWNDKGHMAVAGYAFDLLEPQIRERVAELLKLNPSAPRPSLSCRCLWPCLELSPHGANAGCSTSNASPMFLVQCASG